MGINQVIAVIQTAILGLVGSFLVGVIVKFYPRVEVFIVAHTGLERYNKIKAVALDIWNKIEEDGRLGILADTKLNLFENYVKFKFPSLTDADILLLNKSIAGQFNASKVEVIKELTPTTTIVEDVAVPVINYYDPLTGLPLAAGVMPVIPV